MSRVLAFLSASALALSVSFGANAFEGRYRVTGNVPGQSNSYEGIALIKKTGETYTILWQIGDVAYLGTGILTAGVLSVAFAPLNARAGPGVASLRISGESVSGGAWTTLGTEVVAHEQWTPLVGTDAPNAPTGSIRGTFRGDQLPELRVSAH